MNKLLSVIVAAMFAVSTTAFVASPVGAQEKKAEKAEKKAKSDKKAAPKKDAAAKKDAKAAPKKDAKKKEEAKK